MAKEYSEVIIIGAGASGLAAAIQLKRKFGGYDKFTVYERDNDLGGTWWANTYPGCASDVPAPLYSFSFAQNPNWSTLFPLQPELLKYFSDVANRFKVRSHIRFNTEVVLCEWIESASLWRVHLRKRKSGDGKGEAEEWIHEAKIVFSCTGGLVEPKDCDIPGKEDFKGDIFHSARWDHSVNLKGKDVAVIGNGCSATQFVPIITPITKSLTQFVRSKHYLQPRPTLPGISEEAYDKHSRSVFKYIPFSEQLLRLIVFFELERSWPLFRLDSAGAKLRTEKEHEAKTYMKSLAPKKYWDAILPDYKIGTKRRILDSDYLPTLSAPNFHLTTAAVSHLLPNAIVTTSGDQYPADTVIFANGFKTNVWLAPLEVRGINNLSLNEHWNSIGGPGAYNCTSCSGFPNFFMIFGPNSATGHTSVIMTAEFAINFALKILTGVIKGEVEYVDVKEEREREYIQRLQNQMTKTVWGGEGGTGSWYAREDGWNSCTYPFSQWHFAYRSMFPTWSDWKFKYTRKGIWKARLRRAVLLACLLGIGSAALYTGQQGNLRWVTDIAGYSASIYNEGVKAIGSFLGRVGVTGWVSEL